MTVPHIPTTNRHLGLLLGLGTTAALGAGLALKTHIPAFSKSFKKSRALMLHPAADVTSPRLQGYIIGGGLGLTAAATTAAGNAATSIAKYRIDSEYKHKHNNSIKAASNQGSEQESDNMMNNTEWLSTFWLNKSAAITPMEEKDADDKPIAKKKEDKKKVEESKDPHEAFIEKLKKEEFLKKMEESKKASVYRNARSFVDQRKQASFLTPKLVVGAVAGAGLYGLATAANIGLSHLAEHEAKHLQDDSIIKQHPYLTNLATDTPAWLLSRSNPILSLGTATVGNFMGQMGASNLGQVIEEGGQVNAPLSGFSYRHPILGPVASMVIPGAHSPNSAIAAHAIANEAQKERNFTYRHPIASTFLHGLIPGAGTAYAIAAAKIEDRKEKAASNLMKRSINNNAFY